MSKDNNLNERLSDLLRLDVRFILGNEEARQEYISLHEIIEGRKPSCTGCSAKSRLKAWKQKHSSNNIVINKPKKMSNTFKLKKGVSRVSVPFTGHVITETSKDEIVFHYFNQASTDKELERRKSFFKVLPTKVDKKIKVEEPKELEVVIETELDDAKKEYLSKFDKKVPNRFKNDLDWILNKLGKE